MKHDNDLIFPQLLTTPPIVFVEYHRSEIVMALERSKPAFHLFLSVERSSQGLDAEYQAVGRENPKLDEFPYDVVFP